MQEQNQSLYCEQLEKDSCGTGLVANLNNIKSHQLIEDALTMLQNMEHRGALRPGSTSMAKTPSKKS
ncbi:MAG: hypothetical protein AAF242_05240, partial [Bacteroidota bacterium]